MMESGIKHEQLDKNKKKKLETFGWDGKAFYKFLTMIHSIGLIKSGLRTYLFTKITMRKKKKRARTNSVMK